MLRDLETPGLLRRLVFGGDVDEPSRGTPAWSWRQVGALVLVAVVAAWAALTFTGCATLGKIIGNVSPELSCAQLAAAAEIACTPDAGSPNCLDAEAELAKRGCDATPTDPQPVTPEPLCAGPQSERVCGCWVGAPTDPPAWLYRCCTPWQDPPTVDKPGPDQCPTRPATEPTTPTTPPGSLPTPPSGCAIDWTRVEYDPASGGAAVATWDEAVKAAEIAAHPEHCDAGRCIVGTADVWHVAVCWEVRARGLACGWQPGEDEITVGDSCQAGARVQGYHVYAVLEEGVRGTVVWPPQARRNSWTLRARAGGPPDLPNPPPPTANCMPPLPPPLVAFGVQRWFGRPGTECYNGSPLVRDAAYCAAVGYTDGRQTCSVRPDCDPDAGPCRFPDKTSCEELIVGGEPAWLWAGDLEHPKDGRGLRSPWRICITAGTPGTLQLCDATHGYCQVVERVP